MEDLQKLDCRGLKCPQPVVRTKDALTAMGRGELLVLLDDATACLSVSRYAVDQGHGVSLVERGSEYELRIAMGQGDPGTQPAVALTTTPPKGAMVVYINSEVMGQGDDELGRILMGAYLETLSHFAKRISHIILVNSGVRLACEGSELLDYLNDLAGMDIQILCCGTCLNYFNLKEKLKVGKVTNMFTILEILSGADKTLRP